MADAHRIPTHPRFVNLTGQKFHRLTVLHFANTANAGKHAMWVCRCECGTIKPISSYRLRTGETKSCGCHRRELFVSRITTHGGTYTPEFRCWRAMRRRCLKQTDNYYRHYGGRGITVCDRWLNSFENFLADMGPKPSREHSLDRVDNDGPYSPENCRWATAVEQAANKRKRARLDQYATEELIAELKRRGLSLHSPHSCRGNPPDEEAACDPSDQG